jgi:endonuclease V-like protein UPF0215 family
MAKAKSTRVRVRGRSRRVRGKLNKKVRVSQEVHNLMGMVSDNLSIVSAVAQAIVAREGEEGTVVVSDLAEEIAALYRSVRLLKAAFCMLDEAMAKGA